MCVLVHLVTAGLVEAWFNHPHVGALVRVLLCKCSCVMWAEWVVILMRDFGASSLRDCAFVMSGRLGMIAY